MYKILTILLLFQFIYSQNIQDNNKITLIVTTNVHGEIEPCGWPKKPLGGLARKATIISELIDERIDPIIFDAGNLFFKKNILDPGIALETAKIQAEVIVDSFNKIGCEAFSPGENDFAAGLNFLNTLYSRSNFDYISCNIYNKSTNHF